ncbi:GNAT family N-acetyltransferase [Pantoea sp. SJZ147]|uniref:GNAT family N-acetyltransferase n=1 Tax=Pantoea sp. SJZ147 TaxID=2572896 RepID=UPI0011A2C969|nr:GNAT family N-acetyltransferase [Pantoea sp. SJZ147]
MKPYILRPLAEQDVSAFRAIRLEALRRHPDAFGADYDRERQQPDAFFAAMLRENRMLAGIDDQGQTAGIVGVRFNPGVKQRHVATLWGMYVRPEWRGSGLAKALLTTAIAEARECRSLKLAVSATNIAAARLYRSAGFQTYATDVAALYVDGVFHDTLLMRRDAEPER